MPALTVEPFTLTELQPPPDALTMTLPDVTLEPPELLVTVAADVDTVALLDDELPVTVAPGVDKVELLCAVV